MSPAAAALAQHLTKRPVSPGAIPPDSPAYVAYHKAMTAWTIEKENLEIAARLEGIHIELTERQQPTCKPRKDYDWRDMTPKRSHHAKPAKKVWDGATKEYNREKQAQRRARVRAAVHEVQAERDGVKR